MKIYKVTQEHQEQASSLAFEIFSSIRMITAYGAGDKLAKQHDELLEKAEKNERRNAVLKGLLLSPSMMATYGKSHIYCN